MSKGAKNYCGSFWCKDSVLSHWNTPSATVNPFILTPTNYLMLYQMIGIQLNFTEVRKNILLSLLIFIDISWEYYWDLFKGMVNQCQFCQASPVVSIAAKCGVHDTQQLRNPQSGSNHVFLKKCRTPHMAWNLGTTRQIYLQAASHHWDQQTERQEGKACQPKDRQLLLTFPPRLHLFNIWGFF